MPNPLWLDLTLIALVGSAGVYDLATRRIPNRLLLAGLLCAFALHLASPTPSAAWYSGAAGAAVGLLVFLPLYVLRGMAAGDVKLMATIGAFTGPKIALDVALAACCLGGVMALVIVLATGRSGLALRNIGALLRPLVLRFVGMPLVAQPMPAHSAGNMPYGLAIASGTLLMLLMR